MTANDRKHWFGSAAASYVPLLPILTKAARKVGYALALHGSMQFDLDLVAFPWAEDSVEPVDLISALVASIRSESDPVGPEQKPNGRLAWIIPFGNGFALDVSVFPPRTSRCPKCDGSLGITKS